MTDKERELIYNIELFYVKFGGSLVEHYIPKSQKELEALSVFLEKYMRPAIDNFKKEMNNG